MRLRMKNLNICVHRKIQFLGGEVHGKQYVSGELPEKGDLDSLQI